MPTETIAVPFPFPHFRQALQMPPMGIFIFPLALRWFFRTFLGRKVPKELPECFVLIEPLVRAPPFTVGEGLAPPAFSIGEGFFGVALRPSGRPARTCS